MLFQSVKMKPCTNGEIREHSSKTLVTSETLKSKTCREVLNEIDQQHDTKQRCIDLSMVCVPLSVKVTRLPETVLSKISSKTKDKLKSKKKKARWKNQMGEKSSKSKEETEKEMTYRENFDCLSNSSNCLFESKLSMDFTPTLPSPSPRPSSSLTIPDSISASTSSSSRSKFSFYLEYQYDDFGCSRAFPYIVQKKCPKKVVNIQRGKHALDVKTPREFDYFGVEPEGCRRTEPFCGKTVHKKRKPDVTNKKQDEDFKENVDHVSGIAEEELENENETDETLNCQRIQVYTSKSKIKMKTQVPCDNNDETHVFREQKHRAGPKSMRNRKFLTHQEKENDMMPIKNAKKKRHSSPDNFEDEVVKKAKIFEESLSGTLSSTSSNSTIFRSLCNSATKLSKEVRTGVIFIKEPRVVLDRLENLDDSFVLQWRLKKLYERNELVWGEKDEEIMSEVSNTSVMIKEESSPSQTPTIQTVKEEKEEKGEEFDPNVNDFISENDDVPLNDLIQNISQKNIGQLSEEINKSNTSNVVSISPALLVAHDLPPEFPKVLLIRLELLVDNHREYTASEIEDFTDEYITTHMSNEIGYLSSLWNVNKNVDYAEASTDRSSPELGRLCIDEMIICDDSDTAIYSDEDEEVIVFCEEKTLDENEEDAVIVLGKNMQKNPNKSVIQSLSKAASLPRNSPQSFEKVTVEENVINAKSNKAKVAASSSQSVISKGSASKTSRSKKSDNSNKALRNVLEGDSIINTTSVSAQENQYKCKFCKIGFANAQKLKQHFQERHPKYFERKEKLKTNRLDVTEPTTCNVCMMKFDNKEKLFDHIIKHTEVELQEAYRNNQKQKLENEKKKKAEGEEGNEKDKNGKNKKNKNINKTVEGVNDKEKDKNDLMEKNVNEERIDDTENEIVEDKIASEPEQNSAKKAEEKKKKKSTKPKEQKKKEELNDTGSSEDILKKTFSKKKKEKQTKPKDQDNDLIKLWRPHNSEAEKQQQQQPETSSKKKKEKLVKPKDQDGDLVKWWLPQSSEAEKQQKQQQSENMEAEPEKVDQICSEKMVIQTDMVMMDRPDDIEMTEKAIEELKACTSYSVAVCDCHKQEIAILNPHDLQIEMVLLCKTCNVHFRRRECFEIHYRTNPECRTNRMSGRLPKLFCSGCHFTLHSLPDMRRHLEFHARVHTHNTITFLCNICKIVFFGVGTLFYSHWYNHNKDSLFVASRYSFPRISVVQPTSTISCSSSSFSPSSSSDKDKDTVKLKEDFLFIAEYVCRICRTPFGSDDELEKHFGTPCDPPIISPNKPEVSKPEPVKAPTIKIFCNKCNKVFTSKTAFNNHSFMMGHIPTLQPRYICVAVTAVQRAYICNVCRSVGKTTSELIEHWSKHNPVIECYSCALCSNYKDVTYEKVQAHFKSWHKVDDISCIVNYRQAEFICKTCNLGFECSKTLQEHCIIHKPKPVYPTAVASSSSSSSSSSSPPLALSSLNPAISNAELPIREKITIDNVLDCNISLTQNEPITVNPTETSQVSNINADSKNDQEEETEKTIDGTFNKITYYKDLVDLTQGNSVMTRQMKRMCNLSSNLEDVEDCSIEENIDDQQVVNDRSDISVTCDKQIPLKVKNNKKQTNVSLNNVETEDDVVLISDDTESSNSSSAINRNAFASPQPFEVVLVPEDDDKEEEDKMTLEEQRAAEEIAKIPDLSVSEDTLLSPEDVVPVLMDRINENNKEDEEEKRKKQRQSFIRVKNLSELQARSSAQEIIKKWNPTQDLKKLSVQSNLLPTSFAKTMDTLMKTTTHYSSAIRNVVETSSIRLPALMTVGSVNCMTSQIPIGVHESLHGTNQSPTNITVNSELSSLVNAQSCQQRSQLSSVYIPTVIDHGLPLQGITTNKSKHCRPVGETMTTTSTMQIPESMKHALAQTATKTRIPQIISESNKITSTASYQVQESISNSNEVFSCSTCFNFTCKTMVEMHAHMLTHVGSFGRRPVPQDLPLNSNNSQTYQNIFEQSVTQKQHKLMYKCNYCPNFETTDFLVVRQHQEKIHLVKNSNQIQVFICSENNLQQPRAKQLTSATDIMTSRNAIILQEPSIISGNSETQAQKNLQTGTTCYYICNYCPTPLVLNSSDALHLHLSKTHNFPCKICMQQCHTAEELRQHSQRQHGLLLPFNNT